MSKITEQIEKIAQPITDELNLELVDVEFVKEGRSWFLRVYVDNPEAPIDIEQCASVSERLSEILDELDPIEQNYFLEVSSPGAERPLKKEKDFEKAIGKFIYIKTYEPILDAKEFEGHLQSYNEEEVQIEVKIKTRRKTIVIPRPKIAVIRLAIDFSAKPD
ncbi:ribosome maturation factor RimP [Planococcus salinarum]|uniref:ribosome maturation factor RimP n=1 Tax=Planococcus salinarum TaxID=622695 RepID=UPI000E3EE112|nr:ribosome maturation factor RimP [Planococcus salinarum]TAA67493.1 ribosome maturation factor RimP [Planococcus salinarum]